MKYNELNWGRMEAIVNKLGLGTDSKTADDFCQAITSVGGKVSAWAKDIMGKPDFAKSISQNPVEIDLCVATTEEILGEKGKSGTLSEIYAGIARMGGELLPAEAGPQLRAQYLDQPNGEWLRVAMEPIKDPDGALRVFRVERVDVDLWLCTDYARPGDVWSSDYRWVFALDPLIS